MVEVFAARFRQEDGFRDLNHLSVFHVIIRSPLRNRMRPQRAARLPRAK
jgi:hypothetical protein